MSKGKPENMRPAQKGNKRAMRYNGRRLTNALESILESHDFDYNITFTNAQGKVTTNKGAIKSDRPLEVVIAARLVTMALAGNLEAIKEIYNRVEGRSVARIDAKVETQSEAYTNLQIIEEMAKSLPDDKLKEFAAAMDRMRDNAIDIEHTEA